jgi:hypothetical protein
MPQRTRKKEAIMKNLRSLLHACAAGFVLFSAAGCAETDRDLYLADEAGQASFSNTLRMPVYLGGCAPFVTERSLDGKWVELGPPFVCIWEGIAVEVASYETVTTPFQAPRDSGLYRLRYGVSAACEPDLPLSQAHCAFEHAAFSNEFEVERELCDPDEFGCRFVPGAPNFLCDDGVHFGGPSGECTRDPSTGACGYEFLSCR